MTKLCSKKTVGICLAAVTAAVMLSSPAGAASLDKESVTLTKGYSTTLSVDDTEGSVQWSTSDKSVATVKNGKVKAVAPGEAVITAAAGDEELQCTVKVVSGKLIPSKKSIEAVRGKAVMISLKALGSHGLKITSSDKKIASASFVKPWDGNTIGIKITPKKNGVAKIKVSMTKHPEIYTVITVRVGSGNTASVSGDRVSASAAQSVTTAPSSGSGNGEDNSGGSNNNDYADPFYIHHVAEVLGAGDDEIPDEQGQPFTESDSIDGKAIELPVVKIK